MAAQRPDWSAASRALSRSVRRKTAIKIASDATSWALALVFTTYARFEFSRGQVDWEGLAVLVGAAIVLQACTGWLIGLYQGRRRTGSFDEVELLATSAFATTCFVTAMNVWVGQPRFVPLSASIASGFVALTLMASARYLWRRQSDLRMRPSTDNARRMVVFGAGEGGAQAITAMLRNPASPYLPVALLDDDPAKSNLEILGVPMYGGRNRLARVAAATGAEELLIAIPSAPGSLVRDLALLAADAKLAVKILPRVEELIDDTVRVSDIREVTDADLLGRHEIDTDVAAIAGYLTGKRVLVTGAGGSIGSELCRQIHRFAPAELIMLDRDESALHAVQLSIDGRGLLESDDLVLLDIRDRDNLDRLFAARRPEVVFHAAALKHLPLLERFPAEGVRTNVWASLDLLECAAARGVERFVNVSTDKAADPTSVLGYTKRLAERLTAHAAGEAEGVYLSVRFGNVLGSRGSVLTSFRAQIAAGGPITVTDPDVTRYFMTTEEACQLVIQAGAVGSGGEALVLDMGRPVRIADVAKRLAEQADRPIEIVYTGLRPGEKLHEDLLASDEADHRPAHPLISHVPVEPLDPDVARRIPLDRPPEQVTATLRDLTIGPAIGDPVQGEGPVRH